jgi:WD40 repeat protein
MKRIRHIGTTWNGSRVAVASFEHHVAIWDIQSGKNISEFKTILDFGGSRLAITADGTRLVAGAYDRYGIACYDADDGALIWQRRELKSVQHIGLISEGYVYCGFERISGRLLDMRDGSEVSIHRGLAEIYVSPFTQLRFHDQKSRPAEIRTPSNGLIGTIERTTFGFLSVTFSPDAVVTSEAGGPIRCFDIETVEKRWEIAPPPGIHATELSYDSQLGQFQAVLFPYQQDGESYMLRIDPSCGKQITQLRIPQSPVYGFCLEGSQLLCWDGSLVSTSTGKLVQKLEFPDTADSNI